MRFTALAISLTLLASISTWAANSGPFKTFIMDGSTDAFRTRNLNAVANAFAPRLSENGTKGFITGETVFASVESDKPFSYVVTVTIGPQKFTGQVDHPKPGDELLLKSEFDPSNTIGLVFDENDVSKLNSKEGFLESLKELLGINSLNKARFLSATNKFGKALSFYYDHNAFGCDLNLVLSYSASEKRFKFTDGKSIYYAHLPQASKKTRATILVKEIGVELYLYGFNGLVDHPQCYFSNGRGADFTESFITAADISDISDNEQ